MIQLEVVHECEIVSVMAGWLVERVRDTATLQGLFISSEGHCVIFDELEPESKTNELMDIWTLCLLLTELILIGAIFLDNSACG